MKCMSSGNHSAQTAHPPSKLTYKRPILGISTSPRNELYRLKLCCLSCMLITSKSSKIPIPGAVFWGLVKPICRNLEISHRCTLQHTDSHLLFQTWSKSVHDKCPKGRVVLVTEKNMFWHRLVESLWRFPWNFYMRVCTVVPHLYFRFRPSQFRFAGVITEKPFCNAQSEKI